MRDQVYSGVHSHQEDLNQLRVKQPKVKSVVQKLTPSAPPAVSPTENVSLKHENGTRGLSGSSWPHVTSRRPGV